MPPLHYLQGDRPSMSKFLTALFIVTSSMVLVLAGCAEKEEQKGAAPAGRAAVPVTTAQATVATVPLELSLFGTVEAKSSVPVKSRVAGQLLEIHFSEGEEVRKGDLLFSIDSHPFAVALRQAEAHLARDRAQQQNARQKSERARQLLEQGIVSQQEYDQNRSEAEALDAALLVDQAAVEHARLQLDYCRIRAPLSGRTGSLLAHAGALVPANDEEPLVVIHKLRPITVAFSVPQAQFERIRNGMQGRKIEVRATLGEGQALPERGVLDFMDNAIDLATGTIRLKATFANAAQLLWPGAFVRVNVLLGQMENAVTVPTAAVQTGQQGAYLFVVRTDDSVEMRPVKVGPARNGQTVIAEGIVAGETVVTDGHMRLHPGAKVRPAGAEAAPLPPKNPAG